MERGQPVCVVTQGREDAVPILLQKWGLWESPRVKFWLRTKGEQQDRWISVRACSLTPKRPEAGVGLLFQDPDCPSAPGAACRWP